MPVDEPHGRIPHSLPALEEGQRLALARHLEDLAARRRSVREFSSRPVPRELIELALRVAGSAPSGAHQQPWHFAAVSEAGLKRRIREAAEEEERRFYQQRAPREWLEALAPLGTGREKPFLETAPWLVAVFEKRWAEDGQGNRITHYYPTESVGIATGLLISFLHQCGLATLTHTPSPMGFLRDLLGRPLSERPFVLLVVGHPAPGATVPDLRRKPLEGISSFHPSVEDTP